jgi:hypothetical protein
MTMKNLLFKTILLTVLTVSVTRAQHSARDPLFKMHDLLSKRSPVFQQEPSAGRAIIVLDSVLCNLEDLFGDDPLYDMYFEYNDFQQQIKDSTYTWDLNALTGELFRTLTQKQFYTYYPSGDLFTETSVYWDEDAQEWSLDTIRLTYFYEEGLLIKVLNESYNSDWGGWGIDVIDTLFYEGDVVTGRLAGYLDFENNFIPVARLSYEYDQDLLVKETFEFTFDGEEWIEFFYTDYFYVLEKLYSSETYAYDEESESYEPLESSHFIYNIHDRYDIVISSLWLGDWFPFSRCTYYYTVDGVSAIDDKTLPLAQVEMANPFPGGIVAVPSLVPQKDYRLDLVDLHGKTIQTSVQNGNQWFCRLLNIRVCTSFVLAMEPNR